MGAPRGNKFALGLTTNGQPPAYSSSEELANKINEYFDSLITVVENEGEDDKYVFNDKPRITDMALFLGFSSRQSIYDYAKREDYSYIIKRAQMCIESSYEEMLSSKAATGAIFALKNMGWFDKIINENIEIDKEPSIIVNVDSKKIDLKKK